MKYQAKKKPNETVVTKSLDTSRSVSSRNDAEPKAPYVLLALCMHLLLLVDIYSDLRY